MSPKHSEINNVCINLCQKYVDAEPQIIAQLQLVQKFNIHKQLGRKNLFLYAEEICGLSKGQAYVFTSLAKKSANHKQLDVALSSGKLSVSKASRIVSIINEENAESLVNFATTHSFRDIEREVRRISPKAAVKASIKPLSQDLDRLDVAISRKASDDITRSMAIISQKLGSNCDLSKAVEYVFGDFVRKEDPLQKAERAQKRKAKSYPHFSARAEKTNQPNNEPLTAAQKHAVDLRDGRKCTHLHNGQRCNADRWLAYHHIIPRHMGGSNEPENLTTLCTFHHDLVHQMEFPMEGAAEYRAH